MHNSLLLHQKLGLNYRVAEVEERLGDYFEQTGNIEMARESFLRSISPAVFHEPPIVYASVPMNTVEVLEASSEVMTWRVDARDMPRYTPHASRCTAHMIPKLL